MKCSAAIVTEIIMIYIIGTCKSCQVVSYSYITFGIICRLDDLMCMTVGEVDVNQVLSTANIKYSKIEAHKGFMEFYREVMKNGIKFDVDGLFIVF